MKKFSHVAAFFVLFASFAAPSLVSAACVAFTPCTTSSGSQGTCDDVGAGNCIANTVSGGASVNQEWAIYYKNLIIWGVNSVFVPILFAIAFLVFLWGVYKYFILGAADEKSRTDGKQFVLWGLIGFVVISSVWGLVNIVQKTLIPSTAGSNHPNYPTL